ncbi:GIY-YIG nuclease family protein [Planobispora rosea]|uniref:GIY-YIG nuclease family protein n=1 Tax=Planobispora rosea TaxID=35762 RepID=UPI00083B772C|nr:GIY-YIG nuclease family protein [Planobispora rosea]
MTTPDTYEATLQHIELIARKRDKLLAAQLDAENQVLYRAASDYAAGRLSPDGLAEIYQRYRAVIATDERPSMTQVWNENVPVSIAQLKARISPQPNIDGTWRGVYPFADDWRPPLGQSVVYVLYDADNIPCYVGSTQEFSTRLNNHARDKAFTAWTAYPCTDREAAYQLEDRLLKERKPYLNRKASR